MKKILLFAVLSITYFSAQAQMEVKINPFGIFFNSPDVGFEYVVNDNFGVEAQLGLYYGTNTTSVTDFGTGSVVEQKNKRSGFNAGLAAKYYFSPDMGADGWNTGLYLNYKNRGNKYTSTGNPDVSEFTTSGLGIGAFFGKKWVYDSGFLIDIALGGGKVLGAKSELKSGTGAGISTDLFNFDLYGKLSVGYRF